MSNILITIFIFFFLYVFICSPITIFNRKNIVNIKIIIFDKAGFVNNRTSLSLNQACSE